MSDFAEEIPTTKTVGNWSWWQRFWNRLASEVNRIGPWTFVASPAFPLSQRAQQKTLQVLTYTQRDATGPEPLELGADGFVCIYATMVGAGQLSRIRLHRVADDGVTFAAAPAALNAAVFKNGATAVGAGVSISAASSSTTEDLTSDADSNYVDGDTVEVRISTSGGAWGPTTGINWTVQVELTGPLQAL